MRDPSQTMNRPNDAERWSTMVDRRGEIALNGHRANTKFDTRLPLGL